MTRVLVIDDEKWFPFPAPASMAFGLKSCKVVLSAIYSQGMD